MNKKIIVLGGGTFSHVRNHLALAAPAFGSTAHQIADLTNRAIPEMDTHLYLTSMADSTGEFLPDGFSEMVTNAHVEELINNLKKDLSVKVIIFNVALCDFDGEIDGKSSGKYQDRLNTSEGDRTMVLTPAKKIIKTIREGRKDIFLVGFKTTCGATEHEQYLKGLDLVKRGSCNLVLANDTLTRNNMIITPEEAKYHITTNRQKALIELVDMVKLRSHLTFTRSTVVAGTPVRWDSCEVYPALFTIVNYCIKEGAYKPFNGATVGHFACKLSDTEFLTSIRKSNFNDIQKNGLVRIKTDGPDSVIAYGAKPSVGGQSQRIIFHDNPDYDCIVHFHCPIKTGSEVPIISQREYECGSHECGRNTSNGLKHFEIDGAKFSAVMLDNHGPNIVFNHNINPQVIIDFINDNFILEEKTGGLVS